MAEPRRADWRAVSGGTVTEPNCARLLDCQAIRRGTFTSVSDLISAIGAFIDRWNDHPHPFTWTEDDADEILASIQRQG